MKRFIALMIFVLPLFNLSTHPASAQMEVVQPEPPGSALLVRIEFDSLPQLNRLSSELDIWEVDHEAGFLLALVQRDQYNRLLAEGYRLSINPSFSYSPSGIPDFLCYRTIDELGSDLQRIAADYPEIAQLIQIGSSYEGRPLWVLRISRAGAAGPKPVFFLMANIHGREVITPEVAMDFVDTLVRGYGVDADATWLIDYQEIYVLVSANPDGHVRNEPGSPWAYWRKNTQPYGNCPLDSIGVDINRNFPFRWGWGVGSSGDPCADIFRGPQPGSEPETQAVQNYLSSLFLDQRGLGDGDPAPLDATGIFVSLHSYGDLVLWPWGWTADAAPNGPELAALGGRLAALNQYHPIQASGLYPSDGTIDDWVYGELGIAAYTFEIGDDFYPDCSKRQALVQPNLSALRYAAKAARNPYLTAHGPDAHSLLVLGGDGAAAPPVLSARIESAAMSDGSSSIPISAVEYYLDLPPWVGGIPVAMQPVDGAFDEGLEEVRAGLENLSPEKHILFIRARDSAGSWGPISAVFSGQGTLAFLPFLIRNDVEAE